jgi:Secretion system C-terminal sorting domain
MKKQLLAAAFVASAGLLQAQTILNGAFESWKTTSFDEPNSWFTSNAENPEAITGTKVAGASGFAIQIETKADPKQPGELIGGFISNTAGDPLKGQGGVPFSQQPTAITGKLKANLMGSDTALLLVVFKKNGSVIGQFIFKLNGKSQTTFSNFSFPIALGSAPDSVVIASASSNLITNKGVEIGSKIALDDIAFTGPGVTQTLPNANFEQWTTKSNNSLNDWQFFGKEGISRSTDKYKGEYALKLETIDYGNDNIAAGYISNGPSNGQGLGGRPYTNMIDTLIGWYKYTTTQADTAFIGASFSKGGNFVGGGGKSLTSATEFTYFEIPLSAQMTPDSLLLSISSSVGSNPKKGSTLIIDEVQLKSAPLKTGLRKWNLTNNTIQVYPNPFNTELNIGNANPSNETVNYTLYDGNGKVALQGVLNNQNISTANLSNGIYYLLISSDSQTLSSKKLIKQ